MTQTVSVWILQIFNLLRWLILDIVLNLYRTICSLIYNKKS